MIKGEKERKEKGRRRGTCACGDKIIPFALLYPIGASCTAAGADMIMHGSIRLSSRDKGALHA